MADLARRVTGRLRYLGQWRCVEPVVVFESDDWGFERHANPDLVSQFGEPADWAFESTETPAELDGLFGVLSRFEGAHGRPACFTANFVTGRPDYEAIRKGAFHTYHDVPIGEDVGRKSAWLKGLSDRVFYPQYHGRSHFNCDAWLRDLRDDAPGARELFDARIAGGGALLKGHGWRYHSEYSEFATGGGLRGDELRDWLSGGLHYFRDTFGYSPRSTIAPHYILPSPFVSAWRESGGDFVQGANYRILPHRGLRDVVVSHLNGDVSENGVLFLGRTVKFEPRRTSSAQDLASAKVAMDRCFASGIPVVVDTHRINYGGRWKEQSLAALQSLLQEAVRWRPVFLTSVELGDAIQNHGRYRDVWTDERHTLTPIQPLWRRGLRRTLSLGIARSVKRLESL